MSEASVLPLIFTYILSALLNNNDFAVFIYLRFSIAVMNPGAEHEHMSENLSEPKKKKYAKEAWPGRKPLLNSF